MKKKDLMCGNEEGSVLVYSVVVLLLLTMVGLLGSKTSVYELNLSGSDRAIHELRMAAEGAALVAAQRFELQAAAVCRDNDWSSPTRLTWYSRGANNQFDNVIDFIQKNTAIEAYTQNIANWNAGNSLELRDEQTGQVPADFQNCRYQVIDMGIAPNNSLQTGNNISNLHDLLISGSHQRGQRKCIVQVGYRKSY